MTFSLKNVVTSVFLLLVPAISAASLDTSSLCRERIPSIVCIVQPSSDAKNPGWRPCLKSQIYVARFEAVFDRMPPYLQKMFCGMKSIRIDNQLTTSARAHIYPSSESLLGVIEIRESLLTERISFDLWVSWKEQLNFGAPRSHVVVSPDLPLVQTNLPQDSETMLYVLMVHEFAHLLDSMNHINHYSCEERPQDPWCRRPSWDSLNQTDDGKELPENSSPLIKQLCFYECFNQKIPASQQAKLYQDLLKSTFVDSYATGNNLEDFAESFVFYHLDEEPTARYQLVTPGKTFDLMARFRSEKFAVKRAFLKHFLASSEIIYPGKRKKRTR